MISRFIEKRVGGLIIEDAAAAAHNQGILDRLQGRIKDAAYYELLDEQRNQQDRFRHRGYDYDCQHPEHLDFLMRAGKCCKCQGKPKPRNETTLRI